MITKAIIQSINATGTRCVVRMPLFETSASSATVEAEALVNIPSGIFNGLEVGDRVFVAFEENAIEKPIILGKLFRGAEIESNIRGGGGVFNSLKVNNDAALPASTVFVYPQQTQQNYVEFKTPKDFADYLKWLENFAKVNLKQVDDNFRCFKNWAQWQLKSENVEIDDGDLDDVTSVAEPFIYQEENKECKICSTCTKANNRCYLNMPTDTTYSKL